jgi:hypothetical protein
MKLGWGFYLFSLPGILEPMPLGPVDRPQRGSYSKTKIKKRII